MAYKKNDEYVEVAERLVEFHTRYPTGRVTRHEAPLIVELPRNAPPEKQKTYILYTGAAYRTPDDPRPAIGTAWEPWPGPTPYTKDSEMMNAETSAWGRAIVAAGIPSKKIASKEEILARTGEKKAKKAKPTLEEALQSEELVVKDESAVLLDTLRVLGGKPTVEILQTVTGETIKGNKTAIHKAIKSLSASQLTEAQQVADSLVAAGVEK